MARPVKKGLEYFPFDVDFFGNRKIKELRGKFGMEGVVVYTYLLCQIYDENGYYMQLDDGFYYVASAELGMDGELLEEIILFCCMRGLFDEGMFRVYGVLTSEAIQERFQFAVRRRGRKTKIVVGEFWLLDEEQTEEYIEIEDSFSGKNEGYSQKNYGLCQQKPPKEKKSKEKKIKAKESTVKKTNDTCVPAYVPACVRNEGESATEAYLRRQAEREKTEEG